MTPNNEGTITFAEMFASLKEGRENVLSFLAGMGVASLTELPERFAHSRLGRAFGLLTIIALVAAGCAPMVDGAGPTPDMQPVPLTPTLVSPGESVVFRADVDVVGGDFALTSKEMGVGTLDALYPGAMAKLRELKYDPKAMSFVQFQIADGQGEDEEYLIGIDTERNEIVMPWEVSTEGWGTPDMGGSTEGNRYEWSRVDLEEDSNGDFAITTFSGRYLVISRKGGENGTWSVGLPVKDLNTGRNAVVTEVRGGGGMLFAPAEFRRGQGLPESDEDPAGAVWDPATGTVIGGSTPVVLETAVPLTTTPEAVVLPDYLKNIEILTEAPRTLDAIPRVQMEDVESGAFAEALRLAYINGRIPNFGADVPVFNFNLQDLVDNQLLEEYGTAPLLGRATFGKPHQDYFAGTFIAVSSDGQDWLIDPQVIKVGTGEGEVGILLYGLPMGENGELNVSLVRQRWNYLRDQSLLVVPGYYKDEDACRILGSQGATWVVDECQSYVSHSQTTVVKLFEQWRDSGDFQVELSKIFLFVSPVQFK